MATRDRPVDRGRRRGARIRVDLGDELREARLRGGLSQEAVAGELGWSHNKVGRAERGMLASLSIADLSVLSAALGLALVVKLYPDGSPVRDAAHLALIARFRSRLATGMKLATEVPLPIAGDHRAWDAVVHGAGSAVAVEAETRAPRRPGPDSASHVEAAGRAGGDGHPPDRRHPHEPPRPP